VSRRRKFGRDGSRTVARGKGRCASEQIREPTPILASDHCSEQGLGARPSIMPAAL
jgi:hypothetical protein